jgi:Xaa-Pro aminopeptidase
MLSGTPLEIACTPKPCRRPLGVRQASSDLLSDETGYYKPEAYGIRTENLVVVEPREAPTGAERELLGFGTLSLCPIDRRLVEVGLLTAEERAWVDAYHARVRQELAPLAGGALPWLEAATAPL